MSPYVHKLGALHEFIEVSRNTDVILKEYLFKLKILSHAMQNNEPQESGFPDLNECSRFIASLISENDFDSTQNESSFSHVDDQLESLMNLATVAASRPSLPTDRESNERSGSVTVNNVFFEGGKEEQEPKAGENNRPMERSEETSEEEEVEMMEKIGVEDTCAERVDESKRLYKEDLGSVFTTKNIKITSKNPNLELLDLEVDLMSSDDESEMDDSAAEGEHHGTRTKRQSNSKERHGPRSATRSFLGTLLIAASVYSTQTSIETDRPITPDCMRPSTSTSHQTSGCRPKTQRKKKSNWRSSEGRSSGEDTPGWRFGCLLEAAHYVENCQCEKNVEMGEVEVECECELDESELDANTKWFNLQQQGGVRRRVSCACSNCETRTTTNWRRNSLGELLCNACGLYYKSHKENRPTTMRRDVIRKRKPKPKKTVPAYQAFSLDGTSASEDGFDEILASLQREMHPHLVFVAMQHRQRQQEQQQQEQQQQQQTSSASVQTPPEPTNP
ncbi:hypothetical protein LSTR_LSTR015310 [Laodelphax striatellus]|uniref:GATA-type domain-containing protein n=1 Tax=Laodelphax striatellus TaxID=195883 RepID=A0A482WVP6_LAOST|nr:hypothetical protein LSTR_LSTR015310 [Laodelphax striatellus]